MPNDFNDFYLIGGKEPSLIRGDESLEEYVNRMSITLDRSIKYSEYIKEQLEASIKYSEYLSEIVNDHVEMYEYVKFLSLHHKLLPSMEDFKEYKELDGKEKERYMLIRNRERKIDTLLNKEKDE